MIKVLFILKYRELQYSGDSYPSSKKGLSRGLLNSASFVNEMLNHHGIESKLVQVIDNNCIDREVHQYKPTHVIIEAYWVVPEKFEILTKLHPDVTWIIRNHSELPFLANEGIALGWTLDYLKYPNVMVSRNRARTNEEVRMLVSDAYPRMDPDEINERVVYLPNYYPIKGKDRFNVDLSEDLDIACFGAIRPLKNHLMQAVAAIEFANRRGAKLRFHINVERIEGRGEPILKNLRELFARQTNHELIEHGWLPHDKFMELIRTMDLGLQVSFTESFNIVAADFVRNNVPIVVSKEVFWMNSMFKADPTSSQDIVNHMETALCVHKWFPHWNPNRKGLIQYNRESVHAWIGYLRG